MQAADGRAEPPTADDPVMSSTGAGEIPFRDAEPAGWAEHTQLRRELHEAFGRGESPGLSLDDAILMLDERIAAERR